MFTKKETRISIPKHRKNIFTAPALSLLSVAIASTMYVDTVSAENGFQLEEVVVTARKREESLQDVPVAVQAVAGDFIVEQGIVDVQALAPYTPNFSYATAVGAADVLLMRGAGSIGAGPQFEPSIGQVFDGYFISRSRLGRSAFLDLAQVEILKGPQGAIVGKNTSLGAINVTPKKPTEDFEASLSSGFGWGDQEGPEVSAAISGALSDKVRARFAIEHKDQEGNVKNIAPNAIEDTTGTNDSTAARLILQADLSDNLTSEFLFQATDTTKRGKPREVIWCPPSNEAALTAAGITCDRDQTTSGVAYHPNGDIIDLKLTIETSVLGARFDWEFDNFSLTSLTGYSGYNITDNFEGDQSALASAQTLSEEEYEQFTQELRIAGDGDEFSYMAGIFFMQNQMDYVDVFTQQSFSSPVAPNGRERNRVASVDTDTVSIFGQTDWIVSEDYTLTTGLRWTTEDREGESIVYPTQAFSTTPIPCGGGPQGCSKLDPADSFPSYFRAEISDDEISGNLSLQRNVESGMVYASYARGGKSAGFAVGSALTPDAFLFDGETTDSYEIGGKHELLDNTLRFNWAIFYMQIDGLQTSALHPTSTAPVNLPVNADVNSQGVEVDLTWAASEAMTVRWTAGYSDATFDDFIGNCYNGQTTGCVARKQDQDGDSLPLTPDLSSVLGVDYEWGLDNDMTLRASVNWLYSSDYALQIDQHPESYQNAANKFDLSLVLNGDHGDNNWKVALVGRNLTDEITYQFGSTPPNVGGVGGQRVVSSFPELGRVISAKFTYNWF